MFWITFEAARSQGSERRAVSTNAAASYIGQLGRSHCNTDGNDSHNNIKTHVSPQELNISHQTLAECIPHCNLTRFNA
jgi:hypothetical protein